MLWVLPWQWAAVGSVAALGGGTSFSLAAPVLTWDEEADDATPDFTVDFDEDTAEDDVIKLQIDDNASFTSPTEFTNTLDAAEILAGEISMAVSELADGTYYARVRVEQPEDTPISDWSNVEEIEIVGGGGAGTAGQPIGLLLILTKAA
jgi:hypothetical protein